MLRTAAVVLLALSLPLAGCLGSTDDQDTPLEQANATAGNATAQQAAEATGNTTPGATLEANVTSGQAPLAVAFTLGTDSDDPATVNWSFAPGDGSQATNGTGLPAEVNHTYTQAGDHTATLSIDDGTGTNETNLTIEVAEPEDAEAGEDPDDQAGNATGNTTEATEPRDPVVIEGNATVGHPAHFARCVQEGIDGDIHEIAPAKGGWTYALEPAEAFAIYWWNGNEFIETGEPQGTVPSGATHAEICLKEGNVDTAYTLTLWPKGHPDAPK